MSRGVRGYQYVDEADEQIREGSHDTNRLISVTVHQRAYARARARVRLTSSLSPFLASPGGER